MKMTINVTRDLRSFQSVDGSYRTFDVAGDTTARIEIECGGEEANEILRRLQGMPGVPVIPVDETSSPPTYSDEFGEDPGALPDVEFVKPRGLRDWDSQKARMITMTERELQKLERGDWGTNWKKAALEFRKLQKRAERAAENRRKRKMVEQLREARNEGVDPEKWIPPWDRPKPQAAPIEDFDPPEIELNPNFRRNIEID